MFQSLFALTNQLLQAKALLLLILKAYPKECREQILGNDAIVKLAGEIRAARDEAEVASLDDFVPSAQPATAAA